MPSSHDSSTAAIQPQTTASSSAEITPPSTPPRAPERFGRASRAVAGSEPGIATGAGAGIGSAAGERVNMAPRRVSSPTRSSPRKPPPTHSTQTTHLAQTQPQSIALSNGSDPVWSNTNPPQSTSASASTSTSTSTSSSITTLPTPLSISPSLSHLSSAPKLPPAFSDSHAHPRTHGHARYPSSHTPFSPYRPGEYGRSERGIASERTKIRKVERRLFDDGSSTQYSGDGKGKRGDARDGKEGREDELVVPKLSALKDVQGSSPLAPAFEAKMVLRNGASVDLISWLRTNFHHIHPAQHNSMTPQMSLIGIRALLLERFPRVPDTTELSKAVGAAFPHSHWEMSKGAFSAAEPPTVRGLVWHGKDVADEDDEEEEEREREREREQRERERERRERLRVRPGIITRARAASGMATVMEDGSRSPTQSTLVSPISSSRRAVPDTPARSVLEEFAEIATLADKTPASGVKDLPEEDEGVMAGDVTITGLNLPPGPSPAYALATICNSFDRDDQRDGIGGSVPNPRKRRAETPEPLPSRRRSSTPDKLHGLLAAAEAVEGSPITSVLAHGQSHGQAHGHKRRRTIGGPMGVREVLDGGNGNGWGKRKVGAGRKSNNPNFGSFGFGQTLEEKMDLDLEESGRRFDPEYENDRSEVVRELEVPLNDTASAISLTDLDSVSVAAGSRGGRAHMGTNGSSSSHGSQSSLGSTSAGTATGQSNLGLALGGPSTHLAGPSSSKPHTANVPGSSTSTFPSTAATSQPKSRRPNELPTQGDHPGVDCKPAAAYHDLIRYAIENAEDRRLQLNQIYASIAERFPFFKTLDEKKTAGWQNSIRHNLSLKKMFVRVNKVDGVPDDNNGKGGWWTVQDGIEDKGRPGRKGKAKKGRGSAEGVESVLGVGGGEGASGSGSGSGVKGDEGKGGAVMPEGGVWRVQPGGQNAGQVLGWEKGGEVGGGMGGMNGTTMGGEGGAR